MSGVQPGHVRQWDRVLQSKGTLTFADLKSYAPDNSKVMQDAETSPVTPQMLAAAQLHAECVIHEFHALQEQARIQQEQSKEKINKLQDLMEDLQKAAEEQGEAMSVLGKELHDTRASCAEAQQAARLKAIELEANSQVSKGLQEQLSGLATERDAVERKLQDKTTQVVCLHDKAMASILQSHDLKTKNSRLEQEVDHLQKSLVEQRQRAAESEMKCAQLAQQDAELAAAKQESATRLAAHQDLQREAKDKFDQLQEQLTQRGIDLHAAKEQLVHLQKDFAGKCNEVTQGKQERATLQSSHHATLKGVEDTSAQLQQQLAQKGTDLSSAERELARLRQELSQAQQSKHEASKEAQKHSDQLQQQLAGRDADIIDAKAQCVKLQEDVTSKCDEVIAEKQEQAALQRAHRASQKAVENTSAQLQQQLAQRGTDLSSAERELARLQQELSHAQQFEHEAIKEAQKHSDQLQKQLDRKVTEVDSLQHKLTSLDAELGKTAKAKEDGLKQMGSLTSHSRAALADRDDAIQELTERRNKMEGRATKSQGRGQGLAARLAASGTSALSDRSSGPSSPATPLDESSSVFSRLGPMPAPTSQASSDQGTSWSDDDAAPPGFRPIPSAKSVDGATTMKTPAHPPRFDSIPSRSDDGLDMMEPPPGFGPIPTANTGGPRGALQLRSFTAVYCGPKCRLPKVKHMVPRLARLASQLNNLHRADRVQQAVHQDVVLVSSEEEWELAERYNAVRMDNSLEKSMVYAGTEAPEMAEQLHKAGYYHPDPKQDMWAFGLLMFFVFKGQLPHEHEKAIQEETSLLFANKLYKTGKYTDWQKQVEGTLKQAQVSLQLVKIVMGCLKRDPEERLTAAGVVAALYEFHKKKGWYLSCTEVEMFGD